MLVGRDLPAEGAELGIVVAPRQVAEKLVVGAVLLDDVNDVLDSRPLAGLTRHRHGRAVAALGRLQGPQHLRNAGVGHDLRGVAGQGCVVGHFHPADAAANGCGYSTPCRFSVGRMRTFALDVGDIKICLPSVQTPPGNQPVGMNPRTLLGWPAAVASATTATALLPPLATSSVRPSVLRARALLMLPNGQLVVRPHVDRLAHLPGGRVDHRDAIRVGIRHEQPRAVGREFQVRRVQADVQFARRLQGLGD